MEAVRRNHPKNHREHDAELGVGRHIVGYAGDHRRRHRAAAGGRRGLLEVCRCRSW